MLMRDCAQCLIVHLLHVHLEPLLLCAQRLHLLIQSSVLLLQLSSLRCCHSGSLPCVLQLLG